ncbi:polysaccharide biosynthesis/export family protein [Sphingomonas sp. AX6]|uniref:polysaccharide biosynthesis/export family protein n=1 Tax=Sphingomonas sp. AX6 TaxID=2653171 RepID=UPI001F1FB22E|nr:polysaccharide biosynthesis/export family protein [Sphingomonas sp. AX6]
MTSISITIVPSVVRLTLGSLLLIAPIGPVDAQTSVPPATAAATSPTVTPQYRINIGDELDVFVWGEERMQRAVRVQPDGTFAFPLAGTVKAEGRNVSDISNEIRERISTNYRSAPPDVTVSVRAATEMRFYVVGKVREAGSYTSGTKVNVLQALSMAGGAAEFADLRNAVILRQRPDGSQVVEPVELTMILKGRRALSAGALQRALPTLGSGDVLVIP